MLFPKFIRIQKFSVDLYLSMFGKKKKCFSLQSLDENYDIWKDSYKNSIAQPVEIAEDDKQIPNLNKIKIILGAVVIIILLVIVSTVIVLWTLKISIKDLIRWDTTIHGNADKMTSSTISSSVLDPENSSILQNDFVASTSKSLVSKYQGI